MNNGRDQYALLLYAIDDAVAVHKSLADRSVVNLGNNATQFRVVGMASAVSTIFATTALAYHSESRSIYDAMASISSMASGDHARR